MLRKLAATGLFVLALAPSAYLAWTLRSMAHLGFYHDDSIYWVSAKSLASGAGYRIASLPGEPYQTKYPPLYPALLSLVWKLNPRFPVNLPIATLLAWLLAPTYLAMVWLFLRQCRFGWAEQCALVLLAGLSPIAAVFSFSLMPELLFTALLLASLLLAESATDPDSNRWLALAAGVCAAMAYLTKSAAAPLLITVPLVFAFKKQFAKAGLFIGGMIPAVACWQYWVSQHLSHSADLVTLYYTNYFGFQLYNVPLKDLPLVAWHNLDGFLMGAGKLLTFDVPYGSKHLERIVAAAAIAGCVRLARRTRQLQYPIAAAGMTAVLLVWHYVPDQRFVFPLYPLLLAGLWTELVNVWQALRASWNKPVFADRAAAAVGATVLCSFAAFLVFTTFFGLFRFLPDLFAAYRADFESRRAAYQWIANNAAPEASVYAYDDPVLYLFTGRKSCGLPIPPKFHYHDDQAGVDNLLLSVPDFAREHRLSYLLLFPDDFYRDEHERGARLERRGVESSRGLRAVFKTPTTAIYTWNAEAQFQASLHSKSD